MVQRYELKKTPHLRSHTARKSTSIFFFQLGFTPCKAEQTLQGMELQEKETQKD